MSSQVRLVSQNIHIVIRAEVVQTIMKTQSLPEDVVIKTLSAKGTLTKNKLGKLKVGKKP